MDGARHAGPAFPLPRLIALALGAAGFLAVLAAILLPWFSVPGVAGEPLWSSVYRALTAAVIIAAIAQFSRGRGTPRTFAQLTTAYLVALLIFPYFVTIWSPRFAGAASWLHAQHESITGSSGDLYLGQETKADAWRQRVDVVNRPIASDIVGFPDWTQLDAGRLIDVGEWFGASPWFAIFVRKGWVLALCGSAACLLALLRECGAAGRRGIVRRGLVTLFAVGMFALIPPSAAIVQLNASRNSAQRGDYSAAAQHLERAARWMPALREDGVFVAQRGLFDNALHVSSSEAALFRARLTELRGFDDQAQAQYLAGLDATGPPAVQREYLKSLLSLATDALNSGETSSASGLYAAVLAHDPQNLKASYALQLTAVRNADVPRLLALQAQMQAVYRTFNSPTKQAVLALSHENDAFAQALDGNPAATWQALARARKP